MDMSDFSARHTVGVNSFTVSHFIDFSPTALSVAKEVRICIIAIVLGFTTTGIVRNVLEYRKKRSG